MRIRQEQVVFGATLALLALLVVSGSGGEGRSGARRGPVGKTLEMLALETPAVERALPLARDPFELRRSLFEPPRDTEKLPPLEYEPAPRTPLPPLRPPTAFGPEPAHFARLLRVRTPPVEGEQAGLFAAEAEASGAEAEQPAGIDLARGEAALSPAERMAQVQAYKRAYDWLMMPSYRWGRIQNPDRFLLATRPAEPILWIEFDPATGAERFRGQGAIAIERSRVEEFGFAETPENEIEIARLEFRGELTPGQYPRVLEFASWCMSQHPRAANALAVAEESYRRAAQVSGGDPAARLGLARCHEAAFQFERAYQVYRELMDAGHAQDPLVLVRMAELLARLRLFARAEELFELALRFGRTEWEVRWSYGRYLAERGRAELAREQLEQAARNEPTTPERVRERAGIRTDLGGALLALGDLEGAANWFRRALQADEQDARAIAGLLSVAYLGGGGALDGSAPLVAQAEESPAGPQMLLASALASLAQGELAQAVDRLRLAAQADPLRAALAWRALSYLAQRTRHPEEALAFAEEAYENDPTDVYTLLQRGRVLAEREDYDGALDSYTRALDIELRLPDAAAAMGEIHHLLGNHEVAERYLEAALTLDPGFAPVHALRGQNQLRLRRLKEAEESFQRALALDRLDPTARGGLAWCAYLLGEPVEAQTLFRELDDARRDKPEQDPYRAWARRQIERIGEHEQKVVWTDRFDRQQLMNNWLIEEAAGPKVNLKEGAVWIEGAFVGQGRSRLKRVYNPGNFVSFEARVRVGAGGRVRAGIFAAIERTQRGQNEVRSEVSLSRHPDGMIQTRFVRGGETDLAYADVPVLEWPADRPVVLRIERYGESSETRFRLSFDGIPVAEDVRMPTMGGTTGDLWVGFFVEGEPGHSVNAEVDDVQVVERRR